MRYLIEIKSFILCNIMVCDLLFGISIKSLIDYCFLDLLEF